ncbi:NADPH-dependent FMN reductase [Heyndrickxia sp. FSL K6-6286]|uniref:NADPH-dependent FMN reductase n=1 Tax=Heyndrickxia sp. FSL K6-6286 TaxID=2921510 RepID=UPI00315A0C48
MNKIVILCGSPQEKSKIEVVLRHIQAILESEGFSITFLSVLDFSPVNLIKGYYNSIEIKKFTEVMEEADGVLIGSPVYKASYTGALKSLIDLLPEGALKGTPVFPLMVGGTGAHLLAIEYALKPLINSLKGKPTHGIYILDSQIDRMSKDNPIIDVEIINRLYVQLNDFVRSIQIKNPFIA